MVSQTSEAVAMVGAGIIGRAWTVVFARAGYEVRLFDSDVGTLNSALPAISESIHLLATESLTTDPTTVQRRIVASCELTKAVHEAVYIQESIIEDLEAKRLLFHELDRLTPADAILASSTSTVPGSHGASWPIR